ncbi:MAG: phosphoribosylformylglycinamidine synthase [Alphaproteobacteria bacterium]|nr:phosphoribosylformylglycinamidine synthase [Alphaproteobacteria bacterium]
MTALRIEIENTAPAGRNQGGRLEKWAAEARETLNVPLTAIAEVKVYKTTNGKAEDLAAVFADPVLQQAHFSHKEYRFLHGAPAFVVDVGFRAGVTDNPGHAAAEALALCGIEARVASGSLYFLFGELDAAGAEKVARELLANDLLQKAEIYPANDFYARDRFKNVKLPEVVRTADARVEKISLDIADGALEALSRQRCLALTVDELKHVRGAFKTGLTDVELEIIAQSWSEHCRHKIFGAEIDYNGEKIDSLYKTFVKRATQDVKRSRKLGWLVSVFSDNAGIVRFDDHIDLCIKVETHNSPSALDPYGGALTGILGVNRDILGAGLGARPVANTDVFCLAPPDMPARDEEQFMPRGVKAPKRVLEGVHKGVEDGGNKSGIPTVNGAFFFDRDYAGKPLVFVGTVGVLPHALPDGRKAAEKQANVGDRIFMIGGAIGADGIHGATFSSMEIDENAPATAVQIGDPLTQKRVTDFLLDARDLGLYSAITDNGAGGLSSSVGEMAQMTNGAEIDLALCPVKYPGLKPWELMVSESQERMTVAVPPKHAKAFLDRAERHGVSAADIGSFTDSGNLEVLYNKERVASLPLDFLHDSLPQMKLKATWDGGRPRANWSAQTRLQDRTRKAENLDAALLRLLQAPNITSKEKWVRAYDHEVQAATHVKPFADGGVIWLKPHGGAEENGVAIGCGLAPRLSLHDPYLMAQYAVDEAVRNIVAAGGDPDMCCLLDNFCWPDPVQSEKNPEGAYRLGQLVRACQGLYDVCTGYGMPLVSGKDSMKNDFKGKDKGGRDIAFGVLPTLLVTAMARVKMGSVPVNRFCAAGDLIYLLGGAGKGLGGSEYAHIYNVRDNAPAIDMEHNIALYRRIHQALPLFSSLHDVSEGGMLVALSESMIGGSKGAKLSVALDADASFNEAPGRFIVSVPAAKRETFGKIFTVQPIGTVTDDAELSFNGISLPLDKISAAWKKGF